MKTLLSLLLALACLVMAGCGKNSSASSLPKGMDMQELYTSVTSLDTVPEMLLLDETMMLRQYGIDQSLVKQAVVAVCLNSLRADESWLLEAKDDASLEKLKTLAQNRLTAKSEESITYSPEQYAIIQQAQLLCQDGYLILLVGPDAAAQADLVKNHK